MAYTLTASLALGTSQNGISLAALIFDVTGKIIGKPISTGFVDLGQGNYIWTYSGFTAGFRGGVKFYNASKPSIILTCIAINPEDIELIDSISSEVDQISINTNKTIPKTNLSSPIITLNNKGPSSNIR